MKGLDLRRFKKVRADQHCTTFRDRAGHELKVAHKPLSEGRRKQLEAIPLYADGGEVGEEDAFSGDRGPASEPKWDRSVASAKKFGISEDKLKEIRQFDAPEEQKTLEAMGPVKPEPTLGRKVEDFVGIPQATHDAIARKEWQQGLAQDQKATSAPQPMREVASPGLAPQPTAPAQPSPQLMDSALMGTANQYAAGVANEAKAQGQLGRQQAGILEDQAKTQQALMNTFNEQSQHAMNEVNAVMQDYQKQYINPNHYMESQTTGQKVQTAIGLILSGMGAGLTGGENLAAKFLSDQINRDVEAQKANLGKTENLLGFNLKKYGNMKDAMTMTNAMQQGLYASKIEKAAALSKDPIAKARGLQLAAEFKSKIIPQVTALAKSQTLQALMSSGGNTEADFRKKLNTISSVSPEHYKDLAERYIPGVGIAATKPTDKDRDALMAAKQIKSGLSELQARAATIGTTIPGTEADTVNKTKAAALQLQMKNAYQLGVLSQSDLDMLDKLVANPGSIFTGRAISQLEATKKSMEAVEKGVMGKIGVTPFQGSQGAGEGRTASDARGNKIIMKNGKWVPYGG